MPTRTWFGGAAGVPRPERMKPRTMRIRVKPVTVNSSAGTSVTPASRMRIWTALPPSTLGHRRTVRWRRASTTFEPAAGAARRRACGRGRREPAASVVAEQAGGARLVLGVGADRRDALLGGAEQDEVVADADEVDRAVGAERQRGDRGEAGAGGLALLGGLDLLEDPGEAVDDADDDGEADDHPGDAAATAAVGGLLGGLLGRRRGSAACAPRRTRPAPAGAASRSVVRDAARAYVK